MRRQFGVVDDHGSGFHGAYDDTRLPPHGFKLVEKSVDLVVGGVEVRADADPAAGPVVVKTRRNASSRQARSAPSKSIPIQPVRRCGSSGEFTRNPRSSAHSTISLRQGDVAFADSLDADDADDLMPGPRDHVSGYRRRAVTETKHGGRVLDRRGFELNGRSCAIQPVTAGRNRSSSDGFDVDPAAARVRRKATCASRRSRRRDPTASRRTDTCRSSDRHRRRAARRRCGSAPGSRERRRPRRKRSTRARARRAPSSR